MKVTYDRIADAMYITVRQSEVDQTVDASPNRVLVDLCPQGQVRGIEILGTLPPRTKTPTGTLEGTEGTPDIAVTYQENEDRLEIVLSDAAVARTTRVAGWQFDLDVLGNLVRVRVTGCRSRGCDPTFLTTMSFDRL